MHDLVVPLTSKKSSELVSLTFSHILYFNFCNLLLLKSCAATATARQCNLKEKLYHNHRDINTEISVLETGKKKMCIFFRFINGIVRPD